MLPTVEDDRQLEQLIQLVYKRGGLDCQYYKTNYLKRRLAIRMRATGAKTFREYNIILRVDPEEYHHLLDRLTIHVSHFFRDAVMYKALSNTVVPELKKRNHIRIWSAGCANGEEPYSLAMLFYENKVRGKIVSILATDIDQACLSRAREGVYKESSLVEVAPEWRQRFFNHQGDQWVVSNELKEVVAFQPNDLTGALPAGPFDLIVCRNVMIYFTSQLQMQLLNQFYTLLSPGGYLVLGKTEVLLNECRDLYKIIDLSERIYQRRETEAIKPQ
jgi:chemotaxis protein methyltransferase CheR